MKIEIIRGTAVDSLLAGDAFRIEWSELAGQCPWATAFQSPEFVATWYRAYRAQFEPVLLRSRADDGRLTGLLPLAVAIPDGRLIVAGGQQAEYHAWISTPESGDEFPVASLGAIRDEFPSKSLSFRYLPPGTPTAWVASPEAKRFCTLRARRRPLMRLGDGQQFTMSLNKRSNKGRFRQLEKLGPTEFRRITDPAELEALFAAIIAFYDTRRMALNGIAPFFSDSRKQPFYLAMMNEPGLLHATVLKVGDQVAAAHLGACGIKEVQLGLIAHNPFFAKHSPGKFLMLFLGPWLLQEGFEQLDLTAGGEPYKERFANDGDVVHTLGIFPTPAARRKAAAVEILSDTAKSTLNRIGVRPAKAEFVVKELVRLRLAGLAALSIRHAASRAGFRSEVRIYSQDPAEASGFGSPLALRRDALDDLLRYQPTERELSRQQFVSTALERIEQGRHLYTHVEGGRLRHCGWLLDRPTESLVNQALAGFEARAENPLILDLRTFRGGRGPRLDADLVRAMLHEAARIPGAKRIHVAVPAGDGPMLRLLESLGLVHEPSLLRAGRNGRLQRSNSAAGEQSPEEEQPAAEVVRS